MSIINKYHPNECRNLAPYKYVKHRVRLLRFPPIYSDDEYINCSDTWLQCWRDVAKISDTKSSDIRIASCDVKIRRMAKQSI